MILPAENKTNVDEDLTPEQLENLNVHYVKTISEVLELALPTSRREENTMPRSAKKCLPSSRSANRFLRLIPEVPTRHKHGSRPKSYT